MTPDPTESLRLAQQAGEMDLSQFEDIPDTTESEVCEANIDTQIRGTWSVIFPFGRDHAPEAYVGDYRLGQLYQAAPRLLAELRRTRAERNALRAELERVTRERDTLQIRNKLAYEMNGELRDALTELVEAMESKDLSAFREAHIKSALTAAKDALK